MFDEFLMERYRALKENRVINSVFDHEAHRMRSNGPPPTVDADLSLTSTVSYMKRCAAIGEERFLHSDVKNC